VCKRAFVATVALLLISSLSINLIISSDVPSDTPHKLAIIAHPNFVDTMNIWSLERLRDWHNENDTVVAHIENTTAILMNSSFHVDGFWGDGNVSNPFRRPEEDPITNLGLFNDTQAIIRNYIRYAHCKLNVRYVCWSVTKKKFRQGD
jgi:hypothetical protein